MISQLLSDSLNDDGHNCNQLNPLSLLFCSVTIVPSIAVTGLLLSENGKIETS